MRSLLLFNFLTVLPMNLDGLISLQPNDEVVIRQAGEENSFFVSCRSENGGSVSWHSKDSPVSSLPLDRVHAEITADGGADLVFRWIEQEDQGRYSCTGDKDTAAHFDLVVVQPIDFGDTPKIQMVQMGSGTFRLRCGVTGLPFPTVTWKVKGLNLRNSLEASSSLNSKYEVDGTDLLVRNVDKSDEGRYLCKAVQTVYGSDGSSVLYSDFKDNIIDLRIEQSPSWLEEGDGGGQFYGYVTGTANLTCQAEAEPPPEFSWLDAENQPVSDGEIVSTDYKSTLMLKIPHHNVFGAYTCIAENLHGKLEKVVMLSEGAKPGTPKIDPGEILGTSLELRIVKPAAEMFLHIEGFQVEVKPSHLPWEDATLIQYRLASTGVYIIEGLLQHTYYHVRARSRNKAGLSDASNIIFLKTLGDSPSPLVGGPEPNAAAGAAALLTAQKAALLLLLTAGSIASQPL